MKLIHCGDLHIGRRFQDVSLIEDQVVILNRMIDQFEKERPDMILISGDIYDKNNPSAEAFDVWDRFLLRLKALSIPVLIISGNHDAPERLGVGRHFMKHQHIYLKSHFDGDLEPHIFNLDNQEIAIYQIPFLRPAWVRNCFPSFSGTTYQEAFSFVFNLLDIQSNRINILMSHQFFTYGSIQPELSDSEVGPVVGGLDAIDASILEGFDYVALGHIHRAQQVGKPWIRYAGSPLKYSFSEAFDHKSMTKVTIVDGMRTIEQLPLDPIRDVRIIEGPLNRLLEIGRDEPSNDFIHAILLDEREVYNALGQLRSVYPNCLSLEFKSFKEMKSILDVNTYKAMSATPLERFEVFYEMMNDLKLDDESRMMLQSLLNDIQEDFE